MLAGTLVGQRTHVLEAHAPLAVDEEGLRHAVHAVVYGDPSGRVGGIREAVPELGEEFPRRVLPILDVDADDHDALVLVFAPGALERGRLLVAGRSAPRGPEVEHHYFAAETLETQRGAAESGQREVRRRPVQEWRGNLARGGVEAVSQQHQHPPGRAR